MTTIPTELLNNTRVFSIREELLGFLNSSAGPFGTVAEVGVAFGGFSTSILHLLRPEYFHAFDTFTLHKVKHALGCDTSTVFGSQTHRGYYQDKFPSAFIHEGVSWENLSLISDFFDFAYLDAGHDYESVRKDIAQLYRVVRPGGVIMFDDYTNFDIKTGQQYGVLEAVNDFIDKSQAEVLGISLHPEGFHNIAVRLQK